MKNEDINIKEPFSHDNLVKSNIKQYSSEILIRKFEERRSDFSIEKEYARKSKTSKNTRIFTVDEYLENDIDCKLHKSHFDNPPNDSKLAILHRSGHTTPSDVLKPDQDSKNKSENYKDKREESYDAKTSQKLSKDKLKVLTKFDLMKSTNSILNTSNDKSQIKTFLSKPTYPDKAKHDLSLKKTNNKQVFPNKITQKFKNNVFVRLRRPTQIPERKEKKKLNANNSISMRRDRSCARKSSLSKNSNEQIDFVEL